MDAKPKSDRLPTLFIPHGGGPCFFMDWTMGPPDAWDKMAAWLRGLGASVGQTPKAVLVISAHWETETFSITSHPRPPLLYDYYGFPEHTYHLKYPAPGAPELAKKVRELLLEAGQESRLESERGLDHGVFIPFKLIYPNADIPIIQLSLQKGLSPERHLAVGHALERLRDEGVLIVGSGMSYHNMAGFGRRFNPDSDRFDAWLTETVSLGDAKSRNEKLREWLMAPAARSAHPREEHLLPLMVAAGAAGADPGKRIFTDRVMGVPLTAFSFGLVRD